jgi:hypothetical protein
VGKEAAKEAAGWPYFRLVISPWRMRRLSLRALEQEEDERDHGTGESRV